MKVLVTGAAGFIGMHCSARLLARGDDVLGVDSLSDYYDVRLKQARLAQLSSLPGFRFEQLDISDQAGMKRLFDAERPQRVLHLAAQPGVRYSISHPEPYVATNLAALSMCWRAAATRGSSTWSTPLVPVSTATIRANPFL